MASRSEKIARMETQSGCPAEWASGVSGTVSGDRLIKDWLSRETAGRPFRRKKSGSSLPGTTARPNAKPKCMRLTIRNALLVIAELNSLRLSLGQTMQGVQLRDNEWAPAKEAPAVFVVEDPHHKSMAPGSWPPPSDEPPGVSGLRTSSCKRMASCAAQPEPVCG